MKSKKKSSRAKPRPKHRILVTGAAGSVGALVVEEALARGYEVRASDRPGSALPDAAPGLSWAHADLTLASSIPALLEGMDAVIHTAAWVDIHAPFERQAKINLDAVRMLYEAAEAQSLSEMVHLSTGSLYAPSDLPLGEDAQLMATSGYELAKLLAEDYLRSKVGSGPVVNVIRPALIYGPRGKVLISPLATMPVILAAFDGWLPGVRGGPRTNFVHARDVARASLFLVEHPQPDGEVFNVAADEALLGGEYYEQVMEVGGIRCLGLSLPIPRKLFRSIEPFIAYPQLFDLINLGLAMIWRGVERRHNLAPQGLRPRVDAEALPYVSQDTVFDNARLKDLGFDYLFPEFRSGWEDTIRWYRSQHWLPGAAGQAA